jgi:UPF0716 family protein affecting phage T7 exclusion
MDESNRTLRCRKRWSEWPMGAKAGVIAAGVLVVVPGLVTLCGVVTMGLWNALMPAIFKLPTIGFWQALGLLLLSRILLKGGAGHAGHRHWKRRQVWKRMQEDDQTGMAT